MKIKEFELLDFLNKCSIEFGIFDGEGELVVQANVLNTNNTIIESTMKVRDIMYFTEYGTITLPGQRILEKSLFYINNLLTDELSKITDKIFNDDINESYIETQLKDLCIKIQDYVRNYMISTIQKNNQLGTILYKDKDDNKYIYDLKQLSKYIRCVLKIRN